MPRPRNHRYSPTAGLPELREAIADKTARDSGFDVEAAQVLVTNGGKHAVTTRSRRCSTPATRCCCPAPYWTTYPGGDRARRRRVRRAAHHGEATGFRVTVDQLEAARTPSTKALLFVSPSNPTGAVYPPAEVEAIGRWAVEHGIWVITDEIYEHLTFGEHRFTSMPAARARARRHAASCSTASPRRTR